MVVFVSVIYESVCMHVCRGQSSCFLCVCVPWQEKQGSVKSNFTWSPCNRETEAHKRESSQRRCQTAQRKIEGHHARKTQLTKTFTDTHRIYSAG